MDAAKIVFRNVYSGTTFTVIGEDAAARMDAFASWERA